MVRVKLYDAALFCKTCFYSFYCLDLHCQENWKKSHVVRLRNSKDMWIFHASPISEPCNSKIFYCDIWDIKERYREVLEYILI